MRRASPIRGTWIEINFVHYVYCPPVVPHTGDVDRNSTSWIVTDGEYVVPHTGDVDRNDNVEIVEKFQIESSPIRGTWIEIGQIPAREM